MRLTRAAVARRLGRSIATVRQMEERGSLTPLIDGRGVRRFDEAEIREPETRVNQTGQALPPAKKARHASDASHAGLELQKHLQRQRDQIARLEADIKSWRTRDEQLRARLADAMRELLDVVPVRSSEIIEALERMLALLC